MTKEQLEKLVLASVEALHKAEWVPPPQPAPDVVTPEILGALKVIDATLRAKGFGLKASTGSTPQGFKGPVVGYLGLTVRSPEELQRLSAGSCIGDLVPGELRQLSPVLDVGPSLVGVLQNEQRLPWSFEGGMADEQKLIKPSLSPLESLFVGFKEVFDYTALRVGNKNFEGFKKNEICGGRLNGGRYWDLSLVYGDSPLVCA